MNERRIKVVHVITKLDVGGAQETALGILSRIDRSIFDPILVCGAETGWTGSLHAEARKLGVEVRVLPSLVRRLSPLKDLFAVVALVRFLRREHPEIVHTHSSKAGVIGRTAAHIVRSRLVLHTVHGWSFRPSTPSLFRWLAVVVERRMARWTDSIVVVAKQDRSVGLRYAIGTSEQYCLIRSGVDVQAISTRRGERAVARRDLGLAEGAPVVGTVMRFAAPKDPSTFVRAAAELVKRIPNIRFVVVGDGPDRPSVERSIVAAGLHDRILLTGVRRDVPFLLAAMDVFVLSSHSEGLPRVVAEAMAIGTPVVASDVGGVGEIVVDTVSGLLVPDEDHRAMADAVEKVLLTPGVADSLVASASSRVGNFDTATMVRSTEDLYLAHVQLSPRCARRKYLT